MSMGEERMLLVNCSSSDSRSCTIVCLSDALGFYEGLVTYPNGNMLEGDIRTAQEADKICVQATIGLVPDCVEWRIVLGGLGVSFLPLTDGKGFAN